MSTTGLKFIVFVLCLPFITTVLPGEDSRIINYHLSNQYTRVIREDLRVYEDGKYRGFLYREQRAYLHEIDDPVKEEDPAEDDSRGVQGRERFYQGNVYVLKEMSQNSHRVAKSIDESYRTTLRLDRFGRSSFVGAPVVPLRTSYPLLPNAPVAKGESWEGEGVEYILGRDGKMIEAPFFCVYTYLGEKEYMGRSAIALDAAYSYHKRNPYSPEDSLRISGKIDASILLYTDRSGGYFIRERVERYISGGQAASRRETGFRLVWSEGFTGGHLDGFEERIVRALGEKKEEGSSAAAQAAPEGGGIAAESAGGREETGEDPEIEVRRTEEGVVLNLPNIHFAADKAVILPDERGRLDSLAKLLREVPEASFLVKGHTADIGREQAQLALSRERAKTIIEELVDRGFAATRFIYKGFGGTEPAASNETVEGRAKNRRVEIVVLPK
ncbi:MAG: OmpA family protein [Spirochaetales bacterium]|nr:OmpA family protein [Spirochaetales bacterium]MCF7939400.1 OmpA family protein [Spirochaetales bacterium]